MNQSRDSCSATLFKASAGWYYSDELVYFIDVVNAWKYFTNISYYDIIFTSSSLFCC